MKSIIISKISKNIGWLFFDKIFRMGIGLFVGVWVARYLGPEEFGILNYVIAFAALLTPLTNLGLNQIVVKELVENKGTKTANLIFWTAFYLRLISGFSGVFLFIIIMTIIFPNDSLIKSIGVIILLSRIFESTDVIKYYFDSNVESKYRVWASNISFFFISILKVIFINYGFPLISFGALYLGEIVVASCILFIFYLKKENFAFSFNKKIAKNLLEQSWPLIFSGVAIMIYMRIDEFMLGQMIDKEAVGIYSAAVKVSEIWYFVPITIVSSFFPLIIKSKQKSRDLYVKNLRILFELLVFASLFIALPLSIFSNEIILFLFGYEYEKSGDVLKIHIWGAIFMFLYKASNPWFILENLQKLMLFRTVLGAIANLSFNWFLIPKYGPNGAAYATVLSLFVSGFFANALNNKTFSIFKIQIKSFFPIILIGTLIEMANEKKVNK